VTIPLQVRLRQAWTDMPPPQRVNRALYGLAFASLLVLLAEVGAGTRSRRADIASAPRATRLPSTTAPPSASTTAAVGADPASPGGISLAAIVAEVTTSSIPAQATPAPAAPMGDTAGTGAPVGARSRGGGSGGAAGGAPAASGGSSAPSSGGGVTPAAAQPGDATSVEPAPAPELDPPATIPTTPTTTARPIRTTPTFDFPDFNPRDRTDPTSRDRLRRP